MRAVHDWIRALTWPYPGAFTFLADRKVMLWAAAAAAADGGAAGEVLGSDADGVRIGTADGAIVLTAMSDAGQPPGPAVAWAQRRGLRPGDKFEPVSAETAAWALGRGPEPTKDLAR